MMNGMPEYEMSNPQEMPLPSNPKNEPTVEDNEQSQEDTKSFWSQFFQ